MSDERKDYLVQVKVWGRYACFTRPENKVERLSYPIITPSAAVGVLEAIYWKPAFRWDVTAIGVLRHPERGDRVDWDNYMSLTVNELASEGKDHPEEGYNMEDHRVQRRNSVLRWPCYLIQARARLLTPTADLLAIKGQFNDRVKAGQCQHQPWLGLREFSCYFDQPDNEPVESLNHPDLGWIFHSAELPRGSRRVRYRFCPLSLERGWFRPRLKGVER